MPVPPVPTKKWEGQLTLGCRLGKGAFGTVIEASTELLVEGTPCWDLAVKVVTFKLKTDSQSDTCKAIEAEASIIASLGHGSVTPFLDFFMDDTPDAEGKGTAYLVMELEVMTLHQCLKDAAASRTCLPEEVIRLYTRQLLDGLAFVHDNGIVHRDIKPTNILISHDGVARLADFGIARPLDEVGRSLCGTLPFLAPEVLEKQQWGFPADVWALGMVVLIACLGRDALPWGHVTDMDKSKEVLAIQRKTMPKAVNLFEFSCQLEAVVLGMAKLNDYWRSTAAQALASMEDQFSVPLTVPGSSVSAHTNAVSGTCDHTTPSRCLDTITAPDLQALPTIRQSQIVPAVHVSDSPSPPIVVPSNPATEPAASSLARPPAVVGSCSEKADGPGALVGRKRKLAALLGEDRAYFPGRRGTTTNYGQWDGGARGEDEGTVVYHRAATIN